MLRVKLSKLKQVCATALLPRIFKESKSAKHKIDKCAIEYLSKARKSSDSGTKDDHYEKQMRIIEKCFGEKPPETDIREYKDDTKELLTEKIVSINVNEVNVDKKRKTLIAKIFGTNDEIKAKEIFQNDKLQATTARVEEEKLAQKIDHIGETPHVEASVDKVDGFNSTPKVLGHDNATLNVSEVGHDNSSEHEQVNLDELAKRCLGSPVGEIDKILLNELKNLSRESSLPLKVNFPTDDCAQKYFSQIFERKTKSNTIVSDVSNTHLDRDSKEEKGVPDKETGRNQFQPFHLDTVPIFAIDENGISYKECQINRDYLLEDKSLLLDIPAVLEPYGMQAIPFYEYVNKEKIILKDIPHLQEIIVTETMQETENNAPKNEEVVLQREDMDTQIPEINNEAKELEEAEADGPKPIFTKLVKPSIKVHSSKESTEESKLSESDISKLLEYKNVISENPDRIESMDSNIKSNKFSPETDAQYVLTSTTNEPTDFSLDPSQDTSNTAISNTFPTSNAKQAVDVPNNTAISANQNPDEYFDVPKSTGQTFMENVNNITDEKITDNILDHIITTDIKLTDYVDSNETTDEIKVYSTSANYVNPIDILHYTKAYDTKINADVKVTDNTIIDFIVNHTKATYNKVTSNILNRTKIGVAEGTGNIDSSVEATDIKVVDSVVSDKVNYTGMTEAKAADAKVNKNIANNTTTNNTKSFGYMASNATDSDIKTTDNLVSDTKANNIKMTCTNVKDNSAITTVNPMSQSIAYSTMPQLLEIEDDLKGKLDPVSEIPLIDRRGPITHVLVQPEPKIGDTLEAVNSSKKDKSICSEDAIPLSMLLKRVRQRSRTESTRAAYMKAVTKPEEANKNPCIPPLDKSKQKTTLSPNPCRPKPKSNPCKVNPCQPAKKDPCAKLIPFFLNAITRSHTSIDTTIPSIQEYNQMYILNTPLALSKAAYIEIAKKLSHILEFLGIKVNVQNNVDDVVCARDFDPWIPIPSWPIPKVEKKRPLVCPKHGCKLPVRPIPSNTDKPCTGMPKKLSPIKIFLTPLV